MTPVTEKPKVYLGDGAYVSFDGWGLSLTTENGISTTNEIYIEPVVWRALVAYVKQLQTPATTEEPKERAHDA